MVYLDYGEVGQKVITHITIVFMSGQRGSIQISTELITSLKELILITPQMQLSTLPIISRTLQMIVRGLSPMFILSVSSITRAVRLKYI